METPDAWIEHTDADDAGAAEAWAELNEAAGEPAEEEGK